MKAESIQGNRIQEVQDPSRKTKTSSSEAFRDLLVKEMEEPRTESKKGSVEGPGIVAGSALVPMVPSSEKDSVEFQAREQLQRSFDSLERAVQAMVGEATRPKEIQNILYEASQQAHQAWRCTQELPEGHTLRRLGEEVKILAYVETVKWNRGDYLG